MKICAVQLYDENVKALADETVDINERYWMKHGYDFICYNGSLDNTRPTSWSKILAIQNAFDIYECDYVFWLDIDAVVLNHEKKLEDYIIPGYDCIFPTDSFGNPNCGTLLFRRSRWTYEFLEEVYNQKQFINHCWWEQKAIVELESKYPQNITRCNWHDINVDFKNYKKGDFILHIAGGAGRPGEKLGKLKAWTEQWRKENAK